MVGPQSTRLPKCDNVRRRDPRRARGLRASRARRARGRGCVGAPEWSARRGGGAATRACRPGKFTQRSADCVTLRPTMSAKANLDVLNRQVAYSGEGISVKSLETEIAKERNIQDTKVDEL